MSPTPPDIRDVFDAPSPRPRRAVLQALCAAALAIGLVAIFVGVARAPDNVDEVKIMVAQWRSLGAEAALVSERADALPARFVRAHARQMGQPEKEAADALHDLHPAPDVAFDREAVERCARTVGAALESLRRDRGASAGGCTDRLQAIERSLER